MTINTFCDTNMTDWRDTKQLILNSSPFIHRMQSSYNRILRPFISSEILDYNIKKSGFQTGIKISKKICVIDCVMARNITSKIQI